MAPPPPPPEKPIIKMNGFAIRNGVVTYLGYERCTNERLQQLFHPERHCNRPSSPGTLERLRNEASELFSRDFFRSQLYFYGIRFDRDATEAELHSLLDKAILAKQCILPPALILENILELTDAYHREVSAREKVVEREKPWAQLETPSERASHDLDRFMELYFLTDGQPDRAKKPEPLALFGITNDHVIEKIRQRAAQVPGLEVAIALSGPEHIICLGWDRADVCGLAGEIENIGKHKPKEAVQDRLEEAMQAQRKFIETERSEATVLKQSSTRSPEVLALLMARGSFTLQCKTVTDRFPDVPNISKLALDISDSAAKNGETLRAAVDLGVFRGTAVLSFSQAIMK
ncbi:hypothetical protein N0V82_007245 [Gnomoniopsis sp. IMI 355080]|nr:hypothetical protein N0V82_007245 [Gnomoniopsis sp. IMI 355080]